MSYAEWRDRLSEANDPHILPIWHIDKLLAAGAAQFWANQSGAIITEVRSYPGGARICRALAGAGSITALLNDLKPEIEKWAMAQGCTHCMIEGREGWRRTHPDYRHHQTILIKDL